MASSMLNAIVLSLIASLASVCLAGEYCGDKFCIHGCCGISDCCTRRIVYTRTTRTTSSVRIPLVPVFLGGAAVLVVIAVIVICICRRRRNIGVVHGTAAVQQTIVQEHVITAGVQPGVTYPPPPYTCQPAN